MKTIQICEFDRHDTVMLSEIISDYLREEGIDTKSFSFHIEVEVGEKINEKTNRESRSITEISCT